MTSRVVVLCLITLALMGTTIARPAPRTGSEAAFERLSSLVGEWKAIHKGAEITLTYTLTADGSALMEEFRPANQPVMVTMFSVDGDHLVAIHYCSAGNQPQMATGPISAARENFLSFSLVRITGMKTPADWHNTGLEVRLEDKDHFTQNWTWMDHAKTGMTVFHFTRTKT